MEDKIKSTSESMIQIKKKDLKNIIKENNRLNAHIDAKNKLFDNIKNMFNLNGSGNTETSENKNILSEKIISDKFSNLKQTENIKNISEMNQSEVQKGGEVKSESSKVSSIFKKKSCSEKVDNKKESEKYSQSISSISESIKRIRNTMNKSETLQGGTINETTQYETSSISESSKSSDTSSYTSSSSLSSDEISMYSTMEGGSITSMTEEEQKKAYRKLNKEMKYFENKKRINKYDIKKLNLILDGLGTLNKYKK
jgi:hypothetical protein